MAEFDDWLRERHYRPSTLNKTRREIARARELFEASSPWPPSVEGSLRRYTAFLAAEGPQDDFDQAVLELGLTASKGPQQKSPRKQVQQSFETEDWRELAQAIAHDKSPEGCVLHLMLATGQRVGDILRLRRSWLTAGYRTGIVQLEKKGGNTLQIPLAGAQPVWDKLRQYWREGDTVAQWVCPRGRGGSEAGYGAYQRVNRHLKKLAGRLETEGRIHTHRFRRTVAVRALERTKDLHAVKQLLGHSNISTTERYVDELRAHDVANLQAVLLEDMGD